jgi:non-ribosomal peptide synthetase component E (peptide arylation enzyme)
MEPTSKKYERVTHARDVYSPSEIRAFKEAGHWLDRMLVDYLERNARELPDKTAVVDRGRRVTWAELNARANRVAASLIRLGLKPGDFVGVQLPNWIEFLDVYLALQKAGLRAVTMQTIYRGRDVSYMLNKCKARAIVIPDEFRRFDHVAMVEQIRGEIPTLEHVVVVGAPGPGMKSLAELMAHPDAGDQAFSSLRMDPDAVFKVGFTSGTTGLPKGVVHTSNTDMAPPLLTARALGLNQDTVFWMPSPIAHATGLLFGVYDAVLCGGKLVLQDIWDPEEALALISRERAVFTVSATPFIAGMLDVPTLHRHDTSSFKYFLSGGAPIPSALVTRAKEEMGCLLLRVFGQSEAPLHTLNHPSDPWEKIISRDGRPLDGCKVRVVDLERQRELPRGEVGEYATWGPHVFLGYFEEPELTREAKDEAGWYYSSDLCTMDDQDFILYVDRIKDIINRGGVKISALEVENVLMEHPSISRASAVAMADPVMVEKICAFVVLKPGAELSMATLSAFLESKRVTRQKWPERLEIVSELPMTPTGKVQKNLLRDRICAPAAPAATGAR